MSPFLLRSPTRQKNRPTYFVVVPVAVRMRHHRRRHYHYHYHYHPPPLRPVLLLTLAAEAAGVAGTAWRR